MLPAAVRKLSCNPFVRSVAHHLHVTKLARSVYCRLLSRDGDLHVSCLGVEAVFRAHNDKQLAFLDYILTTERKAIEEVLCHLTEGDTFLDVGSHFGIFSVLASKLVGRCGSVIAVEPHEGAAQLLRENLDANRCENVTVLNVAFSDTSGPLKLVYHENGIGLQPSSDPTASQHAIQGVAGDKALQNFSTPAAVKIDVEGHEYAVLTGLRQTLSNELCRLLSIEIHPTLLPSGISRDRIKSFIEECGFRVVSETIRAAETQVLAAR
jgi:FkbM family methyltransferase